MRKGILKLTSFILLGALLLCSVNTVDAATKGKITKVTITKPSKSKLAMKQGSAYQLKVTVKGKSKNKNLKYTSSNSKVVTVSKTGKLKAKLEGKVTITVTSMADKKKKAKIVVSVGKKIETVVGIENVSVTAPYFAKVQLSSAKTLSTSDFSAIIGQGLFQTKVTHIQTIDNINYKVFLDSNIPHGDTINVSIKGLNGISTKQAQYKKDLFVNNSSVIRGVTGQQLGQSVVIYNAIGKIKSVLKSGSLPEGIELVQNDKHISITGTPKAMTNGMEAVITATDEAGRCIDALVKFYIGDSTQIVIPDNNTTIVRTAGYIPNHVFYPIGGSGKYTFETINLPTGIEYYLYPTQTHFILSGQGSNSAECKIKVIDKENPAIFTTLTTSIMINKGHNVRGILKDVSGKVIANKSISIGNYQSGELYNVKTDQNGSFSIELLPGNYYGIINPDNMAPGDLSGVSFRIGKDSREMEDFNVGSGDLDLGEIIVPNITN